MLILLNPVIARKMPNLSELIIVSSPADDYRRVPLFIHAWPSALKTVNCVVVAQESPVVPTDLRQELPIALQRDLMLVGRVASVSEKAAGLDASLLCQVGHDRR